jgi:DnaJ-class molecular chaperone
MENELLVDDSALFDPCPVCDGAGDVETAYYSYLTCAFEVTGAYVLCPNCNGEGRVPRE